MELFALVWQHKRRKLGDLVCNLFAMEFKEAAKLALQSSGQQAAVDPDAAGRGDRRGVQIAVVTLVNAPTAGGDEGELVWRGRLHDREVSPVTMSFEEYERYQKRRNILFDDYRYVAENCTQCTLVGALQSTTGSIVYGTQSSTDTSLRGYTWTMPELQNLNIVQGRGFTQAEEEHASHVALIGTDIEENLLGGADPLNKEIRVDGVPYTIIGMSEKQGKTLGQSQDNWVAVPISAFQKTYGTQKAITIYAKAAGGGAALNQATDEVDSLMRTRRHTRSRGG